MQRTVDHDQRRSEIVAATWRIIARHGMAGATMRQIAQEAGYANGALKPYFPTKADLLQATYVHVFAQTNERVLELTKELHGLDALVVFCQEILPLDEERLDEGRVVIEFWAEATNDAVAKQLFEKSMGEWKEWMLGWCAEIDANRSWERDVDTLLTYVLGTQVSAVLMAGVNGTPAQLETQLEHQLRAFKP